MQCQACISFNFPPSPNPTPLDGTPITNCNDYCRVMHLGANHKDGYHIFGECGNPQGTSRDAVTNCCNCFIYDGKSQEIRILNEERDQLCKSTIHKPLKERPPGCIGDKAVTIVTPPKPKSFAGNLSPTPAPGTNGWPQEVKKTCLTSSADIISTYMCTNYCNNNLSSLNQDLCSKCQQCTSNNSI